MQRRPFLCLSAAGALAACTPAARELPGGFTGIDVRRGHALRDALAQGACHRPRAPSARVS